MKGIGFAALTVLAVAGERVGTGRGVGRSALAPAPEQMRVRFQIAAMEGVLERAVQLGARRLSQQVQAVSPDMLVIAGAARAKGFALDGYGAFFDVDVPAMRRSVAWSFRQLGRPDGTVETAMAVARRDLRPYTTRLCAARWKRRCSGWRALSGRCRGRCPAGLGARTVQSISAGRGEVTVSSARRNR